MMNNFLWPCHTNLSYVLILPIFLVLMTVVYYTFPRSWLQKKTKSCLDPDIFMQFQLVKITPINHNVTKFRFAFPNSTSVLELPIGKHLLCKGKDKEGLEVQRPYTPIIVNSNMRYFELLVKMYPAGRMSHHFREIQEGEYLSVKGPKGRFSYKPGQVKAFGMIAGGSGITPIFQVTCAILTNSKEKTRVHLIYANTTFEDILLKTELDDFAKSVPTRFTVHYILSKPPEDWNGGAGHTAKKDILEHCPLPASNIQILLCGPPGMVKSVTTQLNELGYTPQMQFQF